MRTSLSLVSLVIALACAACIPPSTTGTGTTYGAPPAGDPAASASPPAAGEPGGDAGGEGIPGLRRFIPGQQAVASAPYHRGDYIVALDYRDEGLGTYGFLFHGDNSWWVVEQDQVVGGPIADGGPEMEQVVAAWRAAEEARHDAVMRGVASMPHGCLDGCAFDVHENGRYQGTRIEY